jgi:RNA polymerase sigma-70 factor (ECF subfamily)
VTVASFLPRAVPTEPAIGRASLRAIYDAHAPYVVRCLRYLGVPDADVDDATQETFVIAHRKLEGLRPDGSTRAWLYAIAVNVARHARRSRARTAAREAHEEERTQDLSRPAEARLELQALLGVLDQDKREVVVLYHVEQMTLREIADMVGCPLQTAYSRLRAGTRQLEEARGRDMRRADG